MGTNEVDGRVGVGTARVDCGLVRVEYGLARETEDRLSLGKHAARRFFSTFSAAKNPNGSESPLLDSTSRGCR